MIKWMKIQAGEYESADSRFYITKTWNRLDGNHWQLQDKNEHDRYKGTYVEKSLLDCKLKAETILHGQ